MQDINRFFVAEGNATNFAAEPKVEFGTEGSTSIDIDFEDALGDALCVFKSGGVD